MLDATYFLISLLLELSLLFLGVTFLVGVLQRSIDHDRLQRWLRPERPFAGMLAAAGVGAIVPFCSCSTVPLVAAMRRTGVAMPVLTTFLVISPLVNPATLALLASIATPAYALLYLLGSLAVALAVGALMGRRAWSWRGSEGPTALPVAREPWPARLRGGISDAWDAYRRFAPILVVAGVVAALLHNQVAAAWLHTVVARDDWWVIPVAAVVGVPIYASTAVLLPLGTALYGAGAGLGTTTAFLMGATGLSVPEGMMLSKLLGIRFVVALGVCFTGAVVLIAFGIQALP